MVVRSLALTHPNVRRVQRVQSSRCAPANDLAAAAARAFRRNDRQLSFRRVLPFPCPMRCSCAIGALDGSAPMEIGSIPSRRDALSEVKAIVEGRARK